MSTSSQDKTEQPSEQKLRKAREEGQIARSKELNTAGLLVFGGLAMYWMVSGFSELFISLMHGVSKFDWQGTRHPDMMMQWLGDALQLMLMKLFPFLAALSVLALLLSQIPGGFIFSWKNIHPKFSKLNPFSGLKRMFSIHALSELFKSTLKVVLIGGTLILLLHYHWPALLMMNRVPASVALAEALQMLALSFVILGCVLMLVALFDVPYQRWSFLKKLKMTKQEVKEEHKNAEGNPEVKRRIRQVQMMFARASIDKRVPKADVIIINPTHYSVAIQYNTKRAKAPYVIAKGVDSMALRIRQVATKHNKAILELPDLTRAVYYSTRIDQEIPAGLYTAVAYVLNHVMQLQEYRAGRGKKPGQLSMLPIPPELRQ